MKGRNLAYPYRTQRTFRRLLIFSGTLLLTIVPSAEIGTSTRAVYEIEVAPGTFHLDVSNDTLAYLVDALIFQHIDGTYYTLRFKISTANLMQRVRQNVDKELVKIILRSSHDVEALAGKMTAFAKYRGLDPASFIVSLVQNGIPYRRDEFMELTYPRAYRDYHKYAIETLFDRSGDCEDKVILAASLLKAAGFHIGYVEVPEHILLAVEGFYPDGKHFLYHDRSYYLWEMTQLHGLPGQLSLDSLEQAIFTEVP